ncbi:hypothetical protein QYE76_051121 [Lolium multiflorum]|uniref:Uncharacterized protein n=1 Tax=Lolium multiflorum TaxID=4521 RepID=A0AAD8WHL5_LOLMU|nr:hypothetical protein QYE76_051114 [Lolium multiflorum]KAK1662962.1 hypothetical protein QYE76_051121 [Lolium multiflorum]
MGVGRYIQSSSFAVGGHDWCLRYYPDGFTEDGKDDIAVVLELMEMDPDVDQARVSCTISFFDWTAKRFSSLVSFTKNLSDPDYLISHTINRGEMEASGYVVDDHLNIKCAVTVIKEPYVIEEVGSHIEVPPSDITDQLGKLLQTKEGADVTFEVQGEEFPAHKFVLAMRSPVFKALLYGPMREKDSNRFVVDDMQPVIFKVLLRFIYTDSLPAMDNDLEGDDKKENSYQGIAMSILLSASTCTVESEHLFKILDHSLHRGMGVGHYIQSSCFAVGGHDWCIRYYPDGRDGPMEDNKDAITLVLELVEMDPNEDLARVSCTISFFDWRTKRFSSLVAFTEKFSNSDCLVSRTIDRATVEASDYVVDDRLVEVSVMIRQFSLNPDRQFSLNPDGRSDRDKIAVQMYL